MSEKTLSYNGYCGSVEVSMEDDCLHGKLLFVNDLVTYESESPAALEKAFREAVDYYVDKCSREGLMPDKPFSGSFNVRMTPELHKAAAMKAATKGTTLNDFVRECVASALAETKTVNIHENHQHFHYPENGNSVATAQYEEEPLELWTQTPKAPSRNSRSAKPVTH